MYRSLPLLAVLIPMLAMTACGSDDAPDKPANDTLTAQQPVEAKATEEQSDDAASAVIPLSELKGEPQIFLRRDDAYIDADGRWVVDVVVGSFVMLPVAIRDDAGSRISGAEMTYSHDGDLILRSEVDPDGVIRTNSQGQAILTFDLKGEPREELIDVKVHGETMTIMVNVLSDQVNNYSAFESLEGVLGWQQLAQAKISYTQEGLAATFPEDVLALNGTEVQMVGFMMPLESTPEQKHFVFTSSPPNCFYHIPGGIAGAVEVKAADPIGVTWEPVLLKGKLKIFEKNDVGVIYQLLDAEQQELKLPE